MKKIAITGFSGFVAGHFLDYLYNENIDCEVLGLDRCTPRIHLSRYTDRIPISFSIVDMMDREALSAYLASFQPDYILHLAAFSSVAYSWEHPAESFANNSNIFLNLVDAMKEIYPECRILSVGSSEEYGNVSRSELPLREDQRVNPVSPYAVARVSQELMSKVYVNAFSMKIIMTRSFNHIGPRQDERFVIPSYINRITAIRKAGKTEGEIITGNTDIIRDFVDVRDVVRAYYMLLEKGTPGEIYNICSGDACKLSEMIEWIAEEVGVKVIPKVDPALVRLDDNREIVGTADKIRSQLGWERKWSIRETLHDMVQEALDQD